MTNVVGKNKENFIGKTDKIMTEVSGEKPETSMTAGSASGTAVFSYQDYRLYLKDVLQNRRDKNKNFNMKKMAQAFGFSSHAGLAMILNGQRELRPPYLDKCIKFLNLSINERLYFEAMVRSGSMSTSKQRHLLREVQFLNQTWEPPSTEQNIRMLDYGLVHQIMCLNHRFMSVEEIQSHFRYKIETSLIEQILKFMLDRNQVVTRDGLFKVQTDVLLTADETPSVPAKQLHHDCLKLAINALNDELNQREFQSYIFTIDREEIPAIKNKIKQMVRQIISEFETDLDANTAIQLHFNMFEVVNPLQSESRKRRPS